MAIFNDTFTEASDTKLDAHTPDTGTGWTLVEQSDPNHDMKVNASTDTVVRDGGGLSDFALYSADATYPSADYEVTVNQVVGDTSDDPCILAVRIQDSNNMYAVKWNEDASSGQLYKRVAGTWSTLGTTFNGPANGSICKLKIVGTTLSFEDDGVELKSVTDSAHSAAGKAGLGEGALIVSGEDMSAQEFDDFTVNDLGAAAFRPHMISY